MVVWCVVNSPRILNVFKLYGCEYMHLQLSLLWATTEKCNLTTKSGSCRNLQSLKALEAMALWYCTRDKTRCLISILLLLIVGCEAFFLEMLRIYSLTSTTYFEADVMLNNSHIYSEAAHTKSFRKLFPCSLLECNSMWIIKLPIRPMCHIIGKVCPTFQLLLRAEAGN